MFRNLPRLLLLTSFVAGLVACERKDEPTVDPDPPEPNYESLKNDVRFKRHERLGNDLAQALGLTRQELCLEFGMYDCVGVNFVALGATEPYGSQLYRPLPSTGVSTPIVVDRIALAGCMTRVDRDLESPGAAVIFRGLPIVNGRLVDPAGAPVRDAIDTLYRRAVRRNSTVEERDALVGLYATVDSQSENAARDWAVLACFAALSSVESVFY